MPIKVTVRHWHAAAAWTWNAGDDVCGICRMPFDGCPPGSKFPGDDSPVVWGTCGHAFHLQCISKWLQSDTDQVSVATTRASLRNVRFPMAPRASIRLISVRCMTGVAMPDLPRAVGIQVGGRRREQQPGRFGRESGGGDGLKRDRARAQTTYGCCKQYNLLHYSILCSAGVPLDAVIAAQWVRGAVRCSPSFWHIVAPPDPPTEGHTSDP